MAEREAKVCALLSWYDEAPSWLAASVASLGGVVDHLVAVDGAYALFPEGRASSPVEQQLALVEAAAAARIPLTFHVPERPWAGNEVEKRNATVRFGLAVADGDPSWWLMVVDADMRVTHHSGGLRRALARTDLPVASWGQRERIDVEANPRLARAARLGRLPQESLHKFPCIFRADPTLRYEGAHYVVRTDDGYLFGAAPQLLLPCEDTSLEITFDHYTSLRAVDRRERSHEYYRIRDAAGIERVPELVIA